MKIICAWCNKILGEKEPYGSGRVSHGICEDCRRKIDKEIEVVRKKMANKTSLN